MIPITKMRQKTSSRLSCEANLPDFCVNLIAILPLLRPRGGVSGITLASVGATLVVALLADAARKWGDHKGRP
jgi:hypothetical protein